MLFFFTKLYQEYQRVATWDAEERFTLYVTFILQLLFLSVFVPVWKICTDYVTLGRPLMLLILGGAFAYLFFIGRRIIKRKFFKEKMMAKLIDRYKQYKINRVLLYFLSAVIPVCLMFLGPILATFLKGGIFLGERIEGWIK